MSSPPELRSSRSPRITWPNDTYAKTANQIALVAAPLLLHPSLWTHRREETFTFRDDTRVRRQLTVDFAFPTLHGFADLRNDDVNPTQPRSTAFIPIAVLAKRPLRDFDAFDEDGRPLPVLTKYQNGLVAAYALAGLATIALTRKAGTLRRPNETLRREFWLLATEPATIAVRRLVQLARPDDATTDDRQDRQTIWDYSPFRTLATEFASAFVLLVQADVDPGERRTINLGYEEELPAPIDPTWRSRFGLAPAEVWLPIHSLGFGDSYHAEMLAPDDLVIERATLYEVCPAPEGTDEEHPRPDRAPLTELATEKNTARMHLMTSGREREATGYLSIRLRLARSGLLPATALIAWLTTGLLGGGLVLKQTGISADAEASAALLVALPALFSIVLTRPGEHRLVQRFVTGLRAMVITSGLTSFSAAAVLATDVGSTVRVIVWSLGLLVTALIAIVTTIAYRHAATLDVQRASSDTVSTR